MQYQVVRVARHSTTKCYPAIALLVAVIVSLVTLTPAPAQAQTFTTLYTFSGGPDGKYPGNLVFTPSGNLIGTANGNCPCSITFSLSPQGKETILQQFPTASNSNGETPQGYVLNSSGAVLFGDTSYGGNYEACPDIGCGVVFGIDLGTGGFKLLHEFTTSPDGAYPDANLALDSAGNIYGLTFGGGTDYNGTAFEINTAGVEKILYSFGNPPDGVAPGCGPVRESNGNLFGVTIYGGTGACGTEVPFGCGTVFEVTPAGKETILYNFTDGTDGKYPFYLIGDSSGNLYGLSKTSSDLTTQGIFAVNAGGQFSMVYDGSSAAQIRSFILGPSGTFYAIANGGDSSCGPNGCGQVFKVSPTGGGEGAVEILHSFNGKDGAFPTSLILRDGALYGSTGGGGSTGDGTIYKIAP